MRISKNQRAALSKRTQITTHIPHLSPRTRATAAPPSTAGSPATPDAISQRIRKRIEEAFGWIKGAGLRKTRHRGTARVGWMFTLTAAADNLIRLPKLLAAA